MSSKACPETQLICFWHAFAGSELSISGDCLSQPPVSF